MNRAHDAFDAEPAPARYTVGIDLGTSNSAVAYVDTLESPWRSRVFSIPQLVAPSVVESRDTLPSCHYQRAAGEFAAGAFRLPWTAAGEAESDHAVGFLARDQGAAAPGRLIASAKSWLCHAGVDRLADLLPWHGAADVAKLSPVAASARYLAHLRAAWNDAHPAEPLERQDIVLTLPASFDEVARELTVRAAAEAGLARVVLIEEPQAAFYAWIESRADAWEHEIAAGEKILVCDIGGGTTDFTLIHARRASDAKARFQRVAVGDHLILGGDNMDLALARHVESRLGERGVSLDARSWAVLTRVARQVKETLLGENPPERYTITLPGTGSRLIGGSRQVEVSREEVERLLIDGFAPRVALDARPLRRGGFQEFGLPYAADAAITRYLAAFLMAHRADESPLGGEPSPSAAASAPSVEGARPDVVLFNGGAFHSPLLRRRLIDSLAAWFGGESGWRPRILDNPRLDLAVALGAAYYGMVRRGAGVRIAAGLARAYYIGVDADPNTSSPTESSKEPSGADSAPAVAAVCLVPAGTEEGATIDLSDRAFQLRVREPVEFPLYYSSTRLTDKPGQLAAVDPLQLTGLPPIRTVLEAGKKHAAAETLEVTLHARLTEIGTLDLWCAASTGTRQWRLQFDVRAATHTDARGHQGAAEQAGVVEEQTLATARRLIEEAFGAGETTVLAGGRGASGGEVAAARASAAEGLVKRLAAALDMPRGAWPPTLLREMWAALIDGADARRRAAPVEARWLNLLGFALRPGFGMAVDDWRVARTWRVLGGRLYHSQPMCRVEWWILWRRIAGGLAAGQQRALADPLLAEIRSSRRALAKGRGAEHRGAEHETAEIWRLLGSLELLPASDKLELAEGLMELVAREKTPTLAAAGVWALGRIGSRTPLYGPLNAAAPTEAVTAWIEWLLAHKRPPETTSLALMQLARRTHDRYRDISDALRKKVVSRLESDVAPAHFLELVARGGELGDAEAGLVFGDSLPRGLSLAR